MIDGADNELERHQAVGYGRIPPALNMPENTDPRFETDLLFEPLRDFRRLSGPLRNDGQNIVASLFHLFEQLRFDDGTVEIGFGNHADFRAAGNRRNHGEVAALTPHHLDNERPAERRCGIADFVERVTDDVEGGIDAETVFGPVDVVVDRRRNAYEIEVELLAHALHRAERAVAAEHHQARNAVFFQVFVCLLAVFVFEKTFRTRRADNRPAAMHDPGDITVIGFDDLIVDHPLEPVVDEIVFLPPFERIVDEFFDRGIHSGGVAARAHDRQCHAAAYSSMRTISLSMLLNSSDFWSRRR